MDECHTSNCDMITLNKKSIAPHKQAIKQSVIKMNINKIQAKPDCSILRSYNTLCQESLENNGSNPTQPVKIKILEKLLKKHQCGHPEHHTAANCVKDID